MLPKKLVLIFLSTLVYAIPCGSAFSAGAAPFEDTICEKATPVGRHLNDLVDKTSVLTPELMSAANDMVAVYEDCVQGYDRDVYGQGGHGGEQYDRSNGLSLHRIYSRLALARALQRVGMYDVYSKSFDEARKAYQEAIDRLDQMRPVVGSDSVSGSNEGALLDKGDVLRKAVQDALAAIPSTTASPAPLPSAAPPLAAPT